jgi:hypothetical protein
MDSVIPGDQEVIFTLGAKYRLRQTYLAANEEAEEFL